MSDAHELVQRALAGELPHDDPELQAALAGDATLRAEFESLQRLQSELEDVAMQQAVLAEIEQASWPEGEARLQESLRTAHAPPRSVRSLHRRWIGLAAAAALVVAAVLWWPGKGSQGEPRDPFTMGAELPGAAPVGEVERYAPFTWELELETGWSFELRVYDADLGPEAAAVFVQEELREARWDPTPEELEQLPARMRWVVEPLGPSGLTGGVYSAFAERSAL